MIRTLSPIPNLSPTTRDRHTNHNEGSFTEGLGNFLTSGLKHQEVSDIKSTGRKHILSPIAIDDHVTTILDYDKVRPESRQLMEQEAIAKSTVHTHPRTSPTTASSKNIYTGESGNDTGNNPPSSSSSSSPSSSASPKVRSPTRVHGPKGSLESVGGLSKWEMMNGPIHLQHHPHDHYTGPIEGTQGGIFGYLGKLQELALAPPSNIPIPNNRSPKEFVSRRAQEGELTKTGIGNYIGDETAPNPSSPPKPAKLYAFGEGNAAKSTFLPSSTSPSRIGNGTFDAYNVGSGLYQFISDKGDPPKTRKHVPSELEKLGINHPGAVGQYQPDPSTKIFHKRVFTDHRGMLADEGGLGNHLMTNDADTHRNFSTVDGVVPTRPTLEDPVFHKSQLSPRSGGIAAYNTDQDQRLAPPSDDYLPIFPGDKMAKRRPVAVFDHRDHHGDAVKELLKEEEAEEAITRQLAELDVQLARAGLATTRSAPIGEAGPLNITISTADQNAIKAAAQLSQRKHKHRLSNRWHEERNHSHVKFGTSSPAAAAVASSGRIPLDGARLARVRTALRATLPKDNQAALITLKHRLMLRDGDADGILTDEELLRTLIDLSPSNISASDVGHMARYLREHGRILRSNAQAVADASSEDHGQTVRRAHHKNIRIGGESGIRVEDANDLDDYEEQEEGHGSANYNDDDSVEIVDNQGKFWSTKRDRRIRKAQEENDRNDNNLERDTEKDGEREEGIMVDAMANWLLGLEGIGKNNASPPVRSGNLVGILAHPTEKSSSPSKNETKEMNEELASRLDFASKDMAYTTFRVAWENKYGAPARKEMNNDLMEGSEGPTWTKATPTPFKVLHLVSSPPTANAVVNEMYRENLSLNRV